jgi:transglutaminase-like putative cysteine protease
MRLLTVRHETLYRYARPVGLGEHRMMFRPRESHGLRLLSARITVTPTPSEFRWQHDVFDNSVTVVKFSGTTDALRFENSFTVEQTETALPDYPIPDAARHYPFEYAADERPDLALGLERLDLSPEVTRWAAAFLPSHGGIETMALLQSITLGIYEDFAYSRRSERGVQSASETLQTRRGTCRDFAVLMIEGARALGFAARFVSGYIFVPEGDPRDGGGRGSTHAWVQVYLPGAGWVDFDPTNRIFGNRNLIPVAVAWHPAQAVPLWGSFFGSAADFIGMDVTVRVVDETRPSAQPVASGETAPRFPAA